MGSTGWNPESRFVADIPSDLIMRTGCGSWRAQQAGPSFSPIPSMFPGAASISRTPPVQVNLRPGDKVRHIKFGVGTVLALNASGHDHEVTVSFDGVGTKRLLLSYAQLQKA